HDPSNGSHHRLRYSRGIDAPSRRRRAARRSLWAAGDQRAMKVIIPLAGKGTRLRPHTHITPKPMLKIAGKPVIDYVMEDLQRLGDIEQVIYITGHLKDKVEEYAPAKYPFDAVFIEKEIQDGTAGAVALAREYVDQ